MLNVILCASAHNLRKIVNKLRDFLDQNLYACILNIKLVKNRKYSKLNLVFWLLIQVGLFKGNSFFRLAHFRDLLESKYSRKIIGFDAFGEFPKTKFKDDKAYLKDFINAAGKNSIDIEQMHKVLGYKNIKNYELIKGDINQTVPEYCINNPHLKISLLHIDTDVYEPAVTILNNFYNKVVKWGVIMFDDYGTFPGETLAVDEFFKDKDCIIQKLPISHIPSFIIKQ